MYVRIQKIILWPKNTSKKRREINFEENKINVLVGDSQTGKSSMIPIIDYCLGSSKCLIPVGPIRDKTEWFGLLLKTADTQLLIARREPGEQSQTSEMFMNESMEVEIPSSIEKGNTSSFQVVGRLNQKAGLPSLDFAEDEANKKPYEGRPSIKDFLAFNLQPQHIIANPHTLFYKADSIEHRFKLETVFPMAIGAMKNNTLELQKRAKLLEEELNQKNRQLEERKKALKAWEGEIKSYYVKAIEYGILNDVPFPEDDWTLEKYANYLQQVPKKFSESKALKIDEGSTNKVLKTISRLRQDELQIIEEVDSRKLKLTLIKNFNSASHGYHNALNIQEKRLEPINNGWLAHKLETIHACPFCGSDNSNVKEELNSLIEVSHVVQRKSQLTSNSNIVLDKETTELEKQIKELEERLNRIRRELIMLNNKHEEIDRQNRTAIGIFRYVGRIEQALENLKATQVDGDLLKRISTLEAQLAGINSRINQSAINKRKEDALKRIGNSIVHYKEKLEVENAKNPTELDIKQLTLKISSGSGRTDYLWEIGSGSNWMGYHVSTILALHEHFITLRNENIVPTFIVFDQPSQAYFPENLKDKKDAMKSDDFRRVKDIFIALSDFLKRTASNVQIIVLEHAGPEYWSDVEDTFMIEGKRWNKEDALIPKEWLS